MPGSDRQLRGNARDSVTENIRPGSLTSPSEADASIQNTQIPGGFTIKDTNDLSRERGSNFEDLLRGVPGVTLQSDNEMEVTKISIRGSGVLSEDEPLGLQVLLDGFTFNQGDWEVILEDFDFGGIQYAEVFRGANAFRYGALTLGGAVNLVSKTGYDAAPLQFKLEGGSYGFIRGQASSGGVDGRWDYFVSVTFRERDGFREHSEDIFANFGYKISDRLENRFYLTLARTDREVSSGITKEQMEEDPRQVDPEVIDQDLSKAWGYVRIADKLSYRYDGELADVGAYWWHRNLLERDFFNEESPDGIQRYYSDNYGILIHSVTTNELFGQTNILTVGFIPTLEREVDANFQNLSGNIGPETARDAEFSLNVPFYAEVQQYLTQRLSLQFGLQAIFVQRRFSDFFNQTKELKPPRRSICGTRSCLRHDTLNPATS